MIVLVTGGTGGHVFPAVSLQDYLIENNIAACMIVDQRGNQFIKDKKNIHVISINRSSQFLGKLIYPFSLFFAFLKSIKFIISHKPKMIIGFGGYTALPALLAGFFMRVPISVFEANAFLGKANRFLQKFSACVFTAFPNTKFVQHKNVYQVGLPLRKDIREKKFLFKTPQKNINLLIIGGSQGTSLFSKIIPEIIKYLPEKLQERLNVHQQVRQESYEQVKSAYESLSCNIALKPFFEDMLFEYEWADCIIARSGASTVFELIHAKKPSMLFPYGQSIEGDQLENANFLVSSNAAWVFQEKNLSIKKVADLLQNIMEDNNLLKEKSLNIERISTQNGIDEFLAVIKKHLV